MIKKIIYKLLPVMLLLFTLTAMFGIAPATQAENADNYYLTVDFGTGCNKVWVTIPGQAAQELQSDVALAIPKTNANITMRVDLTKGYEVASLIGNGGRYLLDENYERTWTIVADDMLTLTCQPKVYDIDYRFADEGAHEEPIGGSFPQQYTFGQETKISIPTKAGFTFECWVILSDPNADISTGQTIYPKEGDDFVTLSATTVPNTDSEVLYLKPKWNALQYEVYRYDYIYAPLAPDKKGAPLFNTASLADIPMWKAAMQSKVNGSMGEDRFYAGFEYINEAEYYSPDTSVTVSTDGVPLNIVYRLYKPLEYELVYSSNYDGDIAFSEGVTAPSRFKFDVETSIPNPIRTGYLFMGWTVTVVQNGTEVTFSAPVDLTIDDLDTDYAGDKDTQITLTAKWKSEEYTVHVDLNTGSDTDQYEHAEKYVFESGLILPDPVRSGYTFSGWLINGGSDLQTGNLSAGLYTADITVVAQWVANEYTVSFNGNGGELQPGTETKKVTYDTALNTDALIGALPHKVGHHFLGFTLTLDGDDFIIDANGNFLPSVWNIPSDTTLYAKWDVIYYNVTVNVTNAKVWLNGTLYEGEPIAFAYGTALTVTVNAFDGYKVVAFNGNAVSHIAEYTTSYLMNQTEDVELNISVLQMKQVPAFRADYLKEIFTVANGIPNGTYRITCGSEALSVKVQNGLIYVGSVEVKQIDIPESFFGKTVSVVVCGDGVTASDSAELLLNVASRPEMPLLNNHFKTYYSDATSIGLEINQNSPYTYVYEFALYLDIAGTQLVYDWTELTDLEAGKIVFTNLHPGTYYYIYARVKASDGSYPHGEVNIFQQSTPGKDYLNEKIAELEALRTGGITVDQVIDKAIAAMKALTPPSATFYSDVDGIYNGVVKDLPFAKKQDEKIEALRTLLQTLLATEEFDAQATETLTDLCENAVTGIMQAVTEDEVLSIYHTANTAMKAVKITYLVYGDMELTAASGLWQGSKLFGERMSDIAKLTSSVNEAIQAGKISLADGNTVTLSEALNALRSLDVMAGYNLRLIAGTEGSIPAQGTYTLRMLLPEDLRSMTGLTVAYYHSKTGMLEVLPTERDGDCLVFCADEITDFVILGDQTVNLTGIILALSMILLCQLIAIAWLLIRRTKYAKELRRYSMMLPAILMVRFLPSHAGSIVLVLGGLVVLFQIILMYLLLSSEVIFRRKRKKSVRQEAPDAAGSETHEAETDLPDGMSESASAAATAESMNADDPDAAAVYAIFDSESVSALQDAAEGDDEFAASDELDEAEAMAEELPLDDEAYADETDDGEYDFIEPAVNPRYSLPDDEFSFESEDGEAVASDESAEDTFNPDDSLEWDGEEEAAEDATEDDVAEPVSDASDEIFWDDTAESADLYEDDRAAESSQWQYGEAADGLQDDVAAEDVAVDAEVPEESADSEENGTDLSDETEAAPADEDAGAESQQEFYIEPDARGDAAPAPDYSIYSEEEPLNADGTEEYDGYDE